MPRSLHTDLPWVRAPAGADMLGQPVPVIVCDRIKKEMQVAEVRALFCTSNSAGSNPDVIMGMGGQL